MKEDEIILQLNSLFDIELKENWRSSLINFIEGLIQNNFENLIFLLYKTDVSEQKLKQALQVTPQTNAAEIIADLIIQRLQQKLATKQMFKQQTDIPEDEKF